MLALLHIENIAVIERADIHFGSGFNVLTGETGAGKSIIIDAITAVSGERVFREIIRTGSEKAAVQAVFQDVPNLSWFANNGITYEKDLLLSRDIYADGRNICRVNGQPVNVSMLRTLGRQLIQIHGQHDAQQLFDEHFHLEYLDSFANDSQELNDYQTLYHDLLKIDSDIQKLSIDEGEKQRRIDTLQYQIHELEQASIKPHEDTELTERKKLLQNAERLRSGINAAYDALYGSDDSDGALSYLSDAQHEMQKLTKYTDSFSRITTTLDNLRFSAEDAAGELRALRDEYDFSDDDLEAIEDRLALFQRLRKYGTSCEDMLAFLARAKSELDSITFSDEQIIELKKQRLKLSAALSEAAAKLHAIREEAAFILSERIENELQQLAMPHVRFCCEFDPIDFGQYGNENVRFLMSANAGEEARAISKVASGGELARVMLAMKNVLSGTDPFVSMIFDEVDTGVSGYAALKVAEKLYSVSVGRQVLCVTHLPQIAAMADQQYLITKSEHDNRTFTEVHILEREGRISELARLTGGAVITDALLRSADEMLDSAAEFKKKELTF